MKTLRMLLASILVAAGGLIFVDDLNVRHRYGCDVNDVAAIDPYWGPIDWPTGERPLLAMVPAFTYSFVFWVAAAMLAPWPRFSAPHHGRTYRGTE